jgi:hypothetical protein
MAAKKKAKRSAAPKTKRAAAKRAAPARQKRAPKTKRPTGRATKAAPAKAAPKGRARRPAVALPELPEIEGYVRSLPPPIVPLVNRLRRLVREAAPEAVELLEATGPAYAVNGLFARIETDGGVVRVRFLRGEQLDAPAGTLAEDASVAVTTFEELRENVLSSLVRQAVLLNVRDPRSSGAV